MLPDTALARNSMVCTAQRQKEREREAQERREREQREQSEESRLQRQVCVQALLIHAQVYCIREMSVCMIYTAFNSKVSKRKNLIFATGEARMA
jgi:hypothetical protein